MSGISNEIEVLKPTKLTARANKTRTGVPTTCTCRDRPRLQAEQFYALEIIHFITHRNNKISTSYPQWRNVFCGKKCVNRFYKKKYKKF